MNAEFALQIIHEEVGACRKCPRLVKYREKVAKEKRSVKKPKLVAPAAKEIPAARAEETLSVRKSTGAGTAKSPVRSSRTKELTYEVEVGEPGKTLYVIGHGGFP